MEMKQYSPFILHKSSFLNNLLLVLQHVVSQARISPP